MRPSELRALTAGGFVCGVASWGLWLSDPAQVALFAIIAVVTASASALVAIAAPRRPLLAAAIVIAIPVYGILVALWTVRLSARRIATPPPPKHEAPSYEALVARDVELRRATVGRLADRANPDDLMLLRWARDQDRDLGAEIANALESIEARFATQLRDARAALAKRPGPEAHASVFSTIARGVLARVADPSLVPQLVVEAQLHHDALAELDPIRARALQADRERLAVAARRLELVLAPPASESYSEVSSAFERRVREAAR